jgi:hypothetical protein
MSWVNDARYTSMAVRGTEAILKEGQGERGKRGIWANRRYLITDRPDDASETSEFMHSDGLYMNGERDAYADTCD